MAASAKKKNKKGKTISLTDFLTEDGGLVEEGAVSKSVSWANETDDLEDVSTTWHSNDDDVYRAPPTDRSILPTAPWAAREPIIDRSRLPKSPTYTAFLGNLPYDVTEESIKEFFKGLNTSAVRLPREPSNPERLKGFGYAEFEDQDSLFSALSLNKESLGNRRFQVDVADQAQNKDRDDLSFDSFDDYSPRRGDDCFGDKYRDRYDSDRYRDGYWDGYQDDPHRYGGQDRYDDPGSRDFDRGYDSQIGTGRRAFGSGYRRDNDYRGSRDRSEDRCNRWDDRSWSPRDDYSQDDYMSDDRGPSQRPKLNLKLQSTPKEDDSSASTSQSSRAASTFGGGKPVDTAARERSRRTKLQRQLDDEETQEREWSRTGSESSQTGTSATPSRNARRRIVTLQLLNLPNLILPDPKVMPAPPPKENASVKQSSNPPAPFQSSDTEQQSRTSGGGKAAPEGPERKDESQTGNSSCSPGNGGNKEHWKESDGKDGKKDQDSRSTPEPKKPEENPASKFSSASKYAAVSVSGEDAQ
uniref:Eukaryotic translation initiation factor 4B n=1 Tax=Rhinopithecus bieti TaxID=61621 RepID=A0A2K6L2N1_RHIBE